MAKLIGKRSEMSVSDWLKNRQIGSSNAATVLNINPYETPYQLWSELVSLTPAVVENEHTESGKYLQPAVAGWFADKADLVVYEAEELWQHEEFPFLTATPDYYVVEEGKQGILEVKTTAAHNWKDWEGGPPNHYRAQVLHQLEVRGLQFAYIACLIGGKKLVYFRIELDGHGKVFVRDILVPAAAEFMQRVKTKTPPAITADDCSAVLEAYPVAAKHRIPLPAEMVEQAIAYDKARAAINYHQKLKDAAQAQLMQFIGDAEGADAPNWIVGWPNQATGGLDQKRLREERPDIWAEYKKTGKTRRFSCKNKNVGEDNE